MRSLVWTTGIYIKHGTGAGETVQQVKALTTHAGSGRPEGRHSTWSRCCYDGRMHDREVEARWRDGEKAKLRGSVTVKKVGLETPRQRGPGRYEEAMVGSWPGLPLRAMSGLVVLLKLDSVMVCGPGFHQRPSECPWSGCTRDYVAI